MWSQSGWNDTTAVVNAVTDSRGNTYTLAVGPTLFSGSLSQSIYYAKNIVAAAAGANTVTVTFSTGAVSPDIRIHEYSGADPNSPVDVTVAGSGNSATSSTAASGHDQRDGPDFGANMVLTMTSGLAAASPAACTHHQTATLAEDEMVTATGSYSATAPLSSSGQWMMQMVAFRMPLREREYDTRRPRHPPI